MCFLSRNFEELERVETSLKTFDFKPVWRVQQFEIREKYAETEKRGESDSESHKANIHKNPQKKRGERDFF